MKKIMAIIPHLNIIMFIMLLVFFIINRFNTAMAFLHNNMTYTIIEVFAITSFICSIRMVVYQRKEVKQQNTIAASQVPYQQMR